MWQWVRNTIFFFRRNLLLSILGLIFLISLAGAYLFYLVEAQRNPALHSFGQAIWWTLVSITTVGYGDVVPVTGTGKVLGVLIIFTGVALMSMFTATISSIFVAQKLKEERGLKKIVESNHIILCGWNPRAEQILEVIFRVPQPPLVVFINQLPDDRVQDVLFKFKGKPLQFIRGDFAQEEILNRANLRKARAVIIIPDASSGLTASTDEKTILTAFSVKALQPKVKVFAHILDKDNEPYLKKAQVENYIVSDAYAGVLIGEMVLEPGVPQAIQNLLSASGGSRLVQKKVPAELRGKTFADALQYFRKQGQLPIGVVREQEPLSLSNILSEDYSYLDEFIERKFREAGRSMRKGAHVDVQLNPPDDLVLDKNLSLIVIGS